MFNNIRVVLIETSHPGNIGAAARAMKNMCLSQLYLVSPKSFPDEDAGARAASARDILHNARVTDSLPEALIGCQLVVGTSARLRRVEWPMFTPGECGRQAVQSAQAGQEVAIVFGRERTGLTNSELDRCNALVHIDTNPDYSSLNLAAAVQVIAHEIMQATLLDTPKSGALARELAKADALEGFYGHLQQMLLDIDFADVRQSDKLLRRLRRLFNRAELDVKELNILRGIFSAAQGRKSMRRDTGSS